MEKPTRPLGFDEEKVSAELRQTHGQLRRKPGRGLSPVKGVATITHVFLFASYLQFQFHKF